MYEYRHFINNIFLKFTANRLFSSHPRLIPNMFPNYMRAPNGAEAKPVSQLYKGHSLRYFQIQFNVIA